MHMRGTKPIPALEACFLHPSQRREACDSFHESSSCSRREGHLTEQKPLS